MPPNPDVPTIPTTRRFSQYYVPQAVYLGLDVKRCDESNKVTYAISVHDGSYTTDFYTGEFEVKANKANERECLEEGLHKLLHVVKQYSMAQHYKVQIIALSNTLYESYYPKNGEPPFTAASAFWRELDAIPYHVHTHGDTQDERASAAVRKAVIW